MKPLLVLIGLLLTTPVWAQLHLPGLFGDHMVLQRRKPVPLWGWAPPGERLTVAFRGQTKTSKADKDGRWRVTLDRMEAGGPFALTIRGRKDTLTLHDVLVGEVWICSGQSNMSWTVSQSADAAQTIRKAYYPQIRHFGMKHSMAGSPQNDVVGQWEVCSPATVGEFTAVGYFFARDLVAKLNVPVGLMHASWGGTQAETWLSREAMESDSALRPAVANIPADIDRVSREQRDKLLGILNQKQGGVSPMGGDTDRASIRPGFSADRWPTMRLPQPWENELPNLNGVVWFRRDFYLPDSVHQRTITLALGKVDDIDSTFINGVFVGSQRVWDVDRNYLLPAGVLKPGRNVIAVRVEDGWSGGGMVGEGSAFGLSGPGIAVSLAGEWSYHVATVFPSSVESDPNAYATLLFNAMIHPLIPMAMQGVVWYQGESNAVRAYQYQTTFPLLIKDWRRQWNRREISAGQFPFLFVQLAAFNADNGNSRRGSTWAELREAQTMTLGWPNTGMAVASDIGDPGDIHPKNKEVVGRRLAAEALRFVYTPDSLRGHPLTEASRGPMFDQLTLEREADGGNRVVISFRSIGSGLMTPDRYGYLRGFEIAGRDRQFHYARAAIRGDQVVVYSPEVSEPVAVRYGWADDNSDVNLYNREGFPAVPFRTDAWKGLTEGAKFR